MDDNRDDEIINVQLPRSEYKVMREIIQERETYNNLVLKLKTNWIWFIAGGLLTLFALWDRFHEFLIGAIK